MNATGNDADTAAGTVGGDDASVFADALEGVWVVMPAYNAAATIAATVSDLPPVLRSQVIVVDDASVDDTVAVARSLGVDVICHPRNRGYGGNQKTCYQAALDRGADVVVMVHPDDQYDARMVPILTGIIKLGVCDVVLGNRIRTRSEALDGGMPLWKYLTNRASTFAENLVLGQSIGDSHSGMRAYSRAVLETLPLDANSDDFAFDQEVLVQAVAHGFRIGDVPVPVRYMAEASSIGVRRSLRYGIGGLGAIGAYHLARWGLRRDSRFPPVSGDTNSGVALRKSV